MTDDELIWLSKFIVVRLETMLMWLWAQCILSCMTSRCVTEIHWRFWWLSCLLNCALQIELNRKLIKIQSNIKLNWLAGYGWEFEKVERSFEGWVRLLFMITFEISLHLSLSLSSSLPFLSLSWIELGNQHSYQWYRWKQNAMSSRWDHGRMGKRNQGEKEEINLIYWVCECRKRISK